MQTVFITGVSRGKDADIDIPVDYATPKRECIDRDSQRIWDQIKGNLYISPEEAANNVYQRIISLKETGQFWFKQNRLERW